MVASSSVAENPPPSFQMPQLWSWIKIPKYFIQFFSGGSNSAPVFSSRRTMPPVSSFSLSRQNPDWRHICNLSLFSPALVGHYFQNVEIIKCWKCKEMWIALPQSTQMNTQGGVVESMFGQSASRLKVLSNSVTNIWWKVEISHFNNTWWTILDEMWNFGFGRCFHPELRIRHIGP